MKLSDQAIGAIMMALQKSLLEQSDIVPVLKEMKLDEMDNGELLVTNPPTFEVNKAESPNTKVKEFDGSQFKYTSNKTYDA